MCPTSPSRLALAVMTAVLFSAALAAQGLVPLQPYARTGDVILTDSSSDKLWRLQDLTLDGDYNDAGEITPYYDDTLPGAFALSSNNDVIAMPDGRVFCCDSSTDVILGFWDVNGDGDAQDLGEAFLFFDGTPGGNASGIIMASALGMTADASGALWVAVANSGSGGTDMILRLEDLNFDGDANDAGEATVYVSLPGGSIGDSIPSDVAIGPDGHVYFTDNGTAPGVKGVYRCNDTNGDGDADDPGEVSLYYQPAPQGGTAFHWGLAFDPSGTLYMTDTGNEIIWRAVDGNADFQITPGVEDGIFYQAPGSSSMWRPDLASDGSVYAVEDSSPDRIVRMRDLNNDGDALDPGEFTEVYNESLGAQPAIGARGMSFFRGKILEVSSNTPSVGTPFNIVLRGDAGDVWSLWVSNTPLPGLPVPPLGYLGISVFPPAAFLELFNGFIPSTGDQVIPLNIPSSPGLIGLTVHLQALVGSPLFRLALTNRETVTFQP